MTLCTEKTPWQLVIWEKTQNWVRLKAKQDEREGPEKWENQEGMLSQKSWETRGWRGGRQAVKGDRFIGKRRN